MKSLCMTPGNKLTCAALLELCDFENKSMRLLVTMVKTPLLALGLTHERISYFEVMQAASSRGWYATQPLAAIKLRLVYADQPGDERLFVPLFGRYNWLTLKMIREHGALLVRPTAQKKYKPEDYFAFTIPRD